MIRSPQEVPLYLSSWGGFYFSNPLLSFGSLGVMRHESPEEYRSMPYEQDDQGHEKWRDYSEAELENIRSKHDIVALAVSEGVDLARSQARNGVPAFCPFHENSRTPALALYPDTSSFHCFSCKAAGDVIKFIQLKRGLSFREALEYLEGDESLKRRQAITVKAQGAKPKELPKFEHSEAFCSVCQKEHDELGDFLEHTAWHRARDPWIPQWWIERGVRSETMEALGLGGYVNGRPWATIPIIEPGGNTIGARKRSTSGNKAYRPWRSGQPSLTKPYTIYTAERPQIFIVVEGEIKGIVTAQHLADLGYEVAVITGFGATAWMPAWAEYITGDLIVVPDPDGHSDRNGKTITAGADYADRVLSSVDYYGRSVELPGKIDDLINAGVDIIGALGLPRKPQERMI
jgi:hypothetical protein